jgi:hypothetical protein
MHIIVMAYRCVKLFCTEEQATYWAILTYLSSHQNDVYFNKVLLNLIL